MAIINIEHIVKLFMVDSLICSVNALQLMKYQMEKHKWSYEQWNEYFQIYRDNINKISYHDTEVIRRRDDMIEEEYLYKEKFRFQRMVKDSKWYVTYENHIICWGQYRHDLEEWIDVTYKPE